MISRRVFSLSGLLMLFSRFKIFAQQKQTERLSMGQVEQLIGNGVRLINKLEGKDVTIYFAGNERRFEYPNQHTVVIELADQKKIFLLNLTNKTYRTPAYKPMVQGASISINLQKDGVNPQPQEQREPIFLRYEPSLFQVPAGFRHIS